jgi:hypothetical protein
MASAWLPVQSGVVRRKGCRTASACAVSMLVYIDAASQVKKETFNGLLLMALNYSSRCAELLMWDGCFLRWV